MALAIAICSFMTKLASSISGLGYPYLFEINKDLYLPVMVGMGFIVVSLISTIIIIIMDRKSEKYDNLSIVQQNANINKQ